MRHCIHELEDLQAGTPLHTPSIHCHGSRSASLDLELDPPRRERPDQGMLMLMLILILTDHDPGRGSWGYPSHWRLHVRSEQEQV